MKSYKKKKKCKHEWHTPFIDAVSPLEEQASRCIKCGAFTRKKKKEQL